MFCNPHNPSGRVWTKEEIEKAYAIFKKHDVMVVADEIWSDLILKGHKFVSTANVNEDARMRTITISAPSKTFNLAGFVGSYQAHRPDEQGDQPEPLRQHERAVDALPDGRL